MDRFHKIHYIEWEATGWIYIVRKETDKKANDLKARQCMARNVETYVWCIKTQNEAKVDNWETRSRTYHQIAWYFLHWSWCWRIQAYNEKMLLESCTIPMPAAMLCWIQNNSHRGNPLCRWRTQNEIMLALLRPTNRWGYAWKGLRTNTMKTTSQEEVWFHWVTIIWCANWNLCLKPWKYQMQRQQWRNSWKNWRKYQHGSWRKSDTKMKWSLKHGMRAEQCNLRH